MPINIKHKNPRDKFEKVYNLRSTIEIVVSTITNIF